MTDTGSTPPQIPSIRDVIGILPAALFVTDARGSLVYFNLAFAELSGFEPPLGTELSVSQLPMFLPDGTPLPFASSVTGQSLRDQSIVGPAEVVVQKPDRVRIPLLALAAPLRDPSGAFTGTVNLFVDISGRKEAEAKSRDLLAQFVHREKNEIQTIQSLLTGAQREVDSAVAKEILADTARRVGAIAAAQDSMDRAAGVFDARSLLENVCRYLSQSFGTKLDIQAETSAVSLSNRSALPLAIIINELVTNCVKHGRGDRNRVSVRVALTGLGADRVLTVLDDGPGFQPDAPKRRASGLGLVQGLTRQLGGKLEINTGEGVRVRFGDTAA